MKSHAAFSRSVLLVLLIAPTVAGAHLGPIAAQIGSTA